MNRHQELFRKCLALQQQGRDEKAGPCFRKLLKSNPGDAKATYLLAAIELRLGNTQKALDLLGQAARLEPGVAEIRNLLGITLRKSGRPQDAIEAFEVARTLDPRYEGAAVNLGNTYFDLKDFGRAMGNYRQALALNPGSPAALHGLGNALAAIGDAAEAVQSYRSAVLANPHYEVAQSSLLHLSHCVSGMSAEAIAEAHRAWGQQFSARIAAPTNPAAGSRTGGRVRVGYISPNLQRHSVAYFLEPILANHDRDRFHVTCFHHAVSIDDTTRRLRKLCDGWHDITRINDADAARLIRKERIDVLVDLAGHTPQSRLRVLAYRPAPVQINYLGYPDTSGLPAADIRISDGIADPPDCERFYSERLVRIPGGFLCYRPPADAPACGAAPNDSRGHVTFGSFNHISKVNEEVVASWADILRRVDRSRLVLKAEAFSSDEARERYLRLFAQQGVAAERIDLLARIESPAGHFSAYGMIDIALDPFPYNGTTTTCEALWMGVPVVTLAGPIHAARVGASLLNQVGLPELVANTPETYVEVAATLAGDTDRLRTLRGTLRKRLEDSPLRAEEAFTRRLEGVYLDALVGSR